LYNLIIIKLKRSTPKNENQTYRKKEHNTSTPQPKGDITACWQIHLPKRGNRKSVQKKLLNGTGPKEAAYKIPYKTMKNRIRLVDEENNIWKLSKEQTDKIRKNTKK
jgi:hypothetical protein